MACMRGNGPAVWVASHQNVQLRPVEERDLDLVSLVGTDPAFHQPYEWKGFRNPQVHRRRWKEDGYLGTDDSLLIAALPDGTATGILTWTAIRSAAPTAPTVTYRIGITLIPDYRNQGLGSAAQCLLADHFFWTTLANRIEAGTDLENIAEQRALEKAGFQREGIGRGAGYFEGRFRDGVTYARLRSDPHP